MEQTTFVRCWHPAWHGMLHWRRPHERVALCQARPGPGKTWRAPFAGAPYTHCDECERALRCWVRDAQTVTVTIPGTGDAAP